MNLSLDTTSRPDPLSNDLFIKSMNLQTVPGGTPERSRLSSQRTGACSLAITLHSQPGSGICAAGIPPLLETAIKVGKREATKEAKRE